FARAPDGVAKTQWNLLARVAVLAGFRLHVFKTLEDLGLAPPLKRLVELHLHVEMVFDRRLVAARHKDEVLDPRLARLINNVLDHRLVHDRQHFLRQRLGCGQKTCPKPGNRKHSLSDLLHTSKPLTKNSSPT